MEPTPYRIVIRGRLGDRFTSTFDSMSLESGDGETALVGLVRDRAHLFGILERIRNLGIDLMRVEDAATEGGGA